MSAQQEITVELKQPPCVPVAGHRHNSVAANDAGSNWLRYINRQRNGITATERLDVLLTLREFYRVNVNIMDLVVYRSLVEVCEYLCDWQLLAHVAENGLQLQVDDSYLRYALIVAYWHLGDHETALAKSTSAALRTPDQPIFFRCYQQIGCWQEFIQSPSFLPDSAMQSERVYLQPLGHHHAADFGWQYADPQIAELCCLPYFSHTHHWHEWLADNIKDQSRTTYAVMHREWGFVGSVGFVRYRDTGFFYYWLGKDFQGYGFGPEAVQLLLNYQQHCLGMSVCFAKVYEHNLPSIKALMKMGFKPISSLVVDEKKTEIFFYYGPPLDICYLQKKLLDLMDYLQQTGRNR